MTYVLILMWSVSSGNRMIQIPMQNKEACQIAASEWLKKGDGYAPRTYDSICLNKKYNNGNN